METTKYQLKSDPSKSVEVASDYAQKAAGLVKLALGGPLDVADACVKHPYLIQAGICSRTLDLAEARTGTPEALRLEDEVYLRVCIYGAEKRTRDSHTDDAMRLQETLIKFFQDFR